MNRRKSLLLCFFSLSLLAVYFILPPYRQWMRERAFAYARELPHQWSHTDLEYRKRYRWGNDYRQALAIAQSIGRRSDLDAVRLLVPPAGYFRDRGITFDPPEPAVFYYFTGMKTVLATSDSARDCNWVLNTQGGKFITQAVMDRDTLLARVRAYKSYRYPL